MPTPTLAPVTVYGTWPPEPPSWGGGLGSGLWDGIGWSYFSTPRIVPAWYIAQILNQKEAYYFSHYSQESRYYHDPQTTRGMVEPLVNKLIPETGKFLGYVRDLLETRLDKQAFKYLNVMAQTHEKFMQGIFSWSVIQKDIASGTPPKVAIGSEVASVWGGAAIAGAIAGMGTLLMVGAGMPTVVAGMAIVAIASSLPDLIDLKGAAAKFIRDVLVNEGTHIPLHTGGMPTESLPDQQPSHATLSNVDSGPTAADVAAANDGARFSDYQIYLAMREIATHPADYPEAVAILPEILAEIGRDHPIGGAADAERPADSPSMRPPPEVVFYADLAADSGVKSFTAQDGKSYVLIGDNTPSEMVGGNAINWFMPGSDFDWSNKVVGNPDGYNVLDFSLNEWGVDIVVSGNDRMDKWIADRASAFGLKDYDVNSHFLTHESALGKLRGDGYAFVELKSGSCGEWCQGEYRNIDYVIGSDYDDILVGDVLGGMTFTGRGGNDTFVVHGGGNRIVFNDGNFADPDSGEITTKFIHGLTTAREARDFNLKHYQPAYLGGYGGLRIEPDVLDFSNLDGDLNTEGHQAMRFIGTGKFTGHAGELRYVTEDHHGLDWPVTHDDESGWWRASTVSLEGDRTGDGIADFFIEYTNYADPSTPNGYGYMMAGVIGSNYPYLDSDNFFFG